MTRIDHIASLASLLVAASLLTIGCPFNGEHLPEKACGDAVVCNDNNPCTEDACTAGICTYVKATGTCGCGTIDPGEICDGSDLGGATCESIEKGYVGGALACKPDCSGHDTTSCTPPVNCGNGVIDPNEQCDGMSPTGATCALATMNSGSTGMLECGSGCQLDTSACSTCGNGILEGDEACEDDVGSETCVTQGFLAGDLGCDGATCQFILTGCSNCGNNILDGDEVCDGSVFANDETCQTQGYFTGSLGCDANCSALVLDDCGACTIDADCGTNETCSDKKCTCGTTESSPMIGPACSTPTHPLCSPVSEVCTCNPTQDSCVSGFLCDMGACKCNGSTNCGTGDSCMQGLCQCNGTPCTEGQVCAGDPPACTCDNGSCPPPPGL